MSVKSKAKAVGGFLLKYVLTAGIGALVDRYVKGTAAEAIKNGVKVAVGEVVDVKKLPAHVQNEIHGALLKAKSVPSLPEVTAVLRSKARKK
jgi:hypothetical protein